MAVFNRRDFLKALGLAGAGLYALGIPGCGGKATGATVKARVLRPNDLSDKLAVVTGEENIENMVRRAMDALGGMGHLVKSGDTVVIKPNIAWAQRPEYAACSNPETVATLVKMCFEAGAKTVKVFDRPCEDIRRTYRESGIKKAVEEAGGNMPYIDDFRFANIDIPDGKALTEWPVYRDAFEADVLINVPIPKQHNSTGLTLSLKNLMGVAGGERGTWHQDIHTKIADFYTVARCDLSVIDAFRIMTDRGPRGGSLDVVEVKKTIAICKDNVAADAFAARELFNFPPEQVGYIRQAHERGLGDMNYESRKIAA